MGRIMNLSKSQTVSENASLSRVFHHIPRWLWFLVTILLMGGGGFTVWRLLNFQTAPIAATQLQAIPIKVQTLATGQVEASAEFVGTLEAQARVSLQPQIQGRIDQVLVSSGDRVRQGTPIVLLSLDQTQAQVTSATAAANSSRAALLTAKAQLQAAAAEQAKAESSVRLQQAQFDRTQQLVSEGAQAEQQLDIARNDLETSIATLDAAKKQVDAAGAGVSQATSDVEQAEANIAETQVSLNYKQVVAPIDGVVGDFSVKAGDYVNLGQTLTSIIQNDALDMRISVPSNNSLQLQPGLSVELLDANSNQRLTTGRISFVAPQVSTSAQSILTKARFANPNNKLRDGQYVRARIVWNQEQGILVPTAAISRLGGQSFVFVVEEEAFQGKSQSVVHQRAVKLGDVQGDLYSVIEGVKVGDRIAISNILKLRDKTPVQPAS
jgi:RND family efflux transporter MFP subunit